MGVYSMAEEKLGLAAALQAVGAGELAGQVAEQLPLLPVTRDPVEAAAPAPAEGARGPGRPAGAMNRRTKDLIDYLLVGRGFQHPAVVLAETYSRPVEVLAKELSCTKLEAFRLQQAAAEGLLPYLAPKQLAIEGGGAGGFTLIMDLGGDRGAAPAEDGVETFGGTIIEGKSTT